MSIVNIIMPSGALGANENDDLLDTVMRQISKAHGDEERNWVSKYGTEIENDTFMMHPYCWCERQDCVWCGGCDCPQNAFHYFVDGNEVSYDEWQDFFNREVYDKLSIPRTTLVLGKKQNEWMRLADLANKRRTHSEDYICDYCKGIGIFATHGSEPRMGAPNFWYKPTNLKVWWYKYIGRDMKINRDTSRKELIEILKACTANSAINN